MILSTTDGLPLHVEERGEGPPLILLNGMSQTVANWRTQMRALADRFRVIAYDARAQGRTPVGEQPLSLELHARDLRDLLDGLGIARAHLVGFSHGARVALGAAARYPDRVDHLVLTSTGMNDDALRDTITRGWLEILARGGVEAMAWASLPQILGPSFLAAHHAHVDAMIKATGQRNTVEGLDALVRGLRSFPHPQADAAAVTSPTLLITSDADLLVAPEAARRLAAAIPGARHVTVDDTGHTIPIEQPDRWREQLLAFLPA